MSAAFTVVMATASDYPDFARLFPELEVPEATPSLERFLAAIAADTFFLRDRDHGDMTVGYAWTRPRGDFLHVVHVVTDPAHRRRGVGQALMKAAAERARALGHRRWMLNVKPENVAARRLYEQSGMRARFESVSMRLAWADASRLPAVKAPVHPRVLGPADDARFEAALGLSAGELGAFRPLGRTIVGATLRADESEHDGEPVGVLAFDPPFPGASPVRARAPEHARVLLDAVRPLALPEHDHLFVFVEGDPALEGALAAAGARVVLRALRMEGEVPPQDGLAV